jgi:hypothetical protein
MRADMAAAFLDYESTRDFICAVKCGEAPLPTTVRGKARSREPIWSRAELERFVAQSDQTGQTQGTPAEDLASLVP